ncbi:proline-, glutamic acid- and leucine-rich protein 1-like [Mizuhopecten yessoensis]|uniref:Proline-, glutamic acid-and leucine-rich protein 1 n=1 Tax=Mizuhopecten yessoensis TaxID=6573 RepID=A0A210PWQ9_MIZYE|nr:proline-, glutamic acid- and leucine-rich protein 1-like [Mizuhopecten yessoensis]OWF40909.1 Proline-, glutamic acid- and leucine-rich protein 1 [Mizuhopecten yessoensis]
MADSMIENVFYSFVPSFCDSSGSKPALRQLVDIAEDSKLFTLQKPGKLQEIVSHINTCLNSAKQRVEGLVLLDKVLEQCVTEIFTQNTLTWIRFMIQIFQSHDPPSIQRLACYVCGKILDVVSDFTSLSREVTSLVPQIISALLLAPTEWRNEACLCINRCILNYPGPCATFKGKIDSFVVKELSCDMVPKEIVQCFALLSRCGGGGNMGLKHTEGWTVQLDRVVSSLRGVLDLLYEGLETVTPNMNGEGSTRTLPVGDVPTSSPQRYHVLVSRCHTYSSCLQALLSESFQALVKVPSQLILNLICRILSVNCKTLTARPSTQRLLLAGFIPSLHKLAISLLHSLIKCCKQHLLPHTKLVLTLLVQELVWSHTTPNYGQARPYSELRRSVYGCLSLWFQVSYTFVETSTEDSALCEEILLDAGMQLDTLKLSSSKGDGSSKSDSQPPPPRKKKKTGYQEISQGISSQRKIDRSAGAELVTSALEALYWWLTAVGSQVTHKILQSIQEFAISTCLAMFQQRKNTEIPYRDPCCRYQLLRVLLACCLVPHPLAPSPLHCSLGIFRIGLNDQACMVSNFCLEAQRTLEVLIHPRAPCLKAPVVVTQALVVGDRKEAQTSETSDTDKNVNGHHNTQNSPDTSHSMWQQTVPQNMSSRKRSLILSHKDLATGDSVSSSIFSRTGSADISADVQKESFSFSKKSKTVVSMPTMISSHSDEMEASTSGHVQAIQQVMVGEKDKSSKSDSDNAMEIGVDTSTSVVENYSETEVTEYTSVTKETGDNDVTAVTEQNSVSCDTGVVEDNEGYSNRKQLRRKSVKAKDSKVREVKKVLDKENSEKQEEGEEEQEEQEDSELVSMLSSFVNTVTDSGDDEDL